MRSRQRRVTTTTGHADGGIASERADGTHGAVSPPDLVEGGVPADRIVLAFRSPSSTRFVVEAAGPDGGVSSAGVSSADRERDR